VGCDAVPGQRQRQLDGLQARAHGLPEWARLQRQLNPLTAPLIYGTAWKQERTAHYVSTALRAGFRGFDTACQPKHYDQAGVGAGIAAFSELGLTRASLYLQTKFTPLAGQDPHRVPYDPRAPLAQQIEQSCALSLEHLRTDYLDGLLLHSPLSSAPETLQAWRTLETLVERGVVRRIGISNCYQLEELQRLWEAARVKPTVLQNRFYRISGYDLQLRAFCRAQGITYQSFWTLTANMHLLTDPALIATARAHRRSVEQILFRYLTQREVVPLTGTRSERHMREDLAILEFELTPEQLATIDRLLEH
jgi:diketogulonate reductase-like aldo/keto reductase